MKTIASSDFRKTYARLTEPTVVKVNGHMIGTWIPLGREADIRVPHVPEGTLLPATHPSANAANKKAERDAITPDARHETAIFDEIHVWANATDTPQAMTQAQRDAILRRVNKG